MSKNFLTPSQEIDLISKGYDLIVGIDEAGRGPWAGPVAVGFFFYFTGVTAVDGVNDSKTLNSKSRGQIISPLLEDNRNFCLLGTPKQIDKLGIGNTIEELISKGIGQIRNREKGRKILFLIDGYFTREFDAKYELVKKGDSKYYSIAAASIIAKETRDNLMLNYAEEFPEYGFEKHMGYGTKFHNLMLEEFGPCEIHRKSFKPVAKLCS